MPAPTFVYGLDVLTLALSEMLTSSQVAAISEHCGKPAIFGPPEQGVSSVTQQRLQLLQPNRKALQLTRKAMGCEVLDHVVYIELALDVLARNVTTTWAWMNDFLGRAWFRRIRTSGYLCETTFYYAPKFSKNGKRTQIRPAVYGDRKSKLPNAGKHGRCLHIEMRLDGTRALRAAGIACLDDVLEFDQEAYWKRVVEIYPRSTATGLGRLVRGRSKKPASDEWHRRQGRKLMEAAAAAVGTTGEPAPFVFQSAARVHKQLRRRQKSSDVFSWIESLDARPRRRAKSTKPLLI